MHKIAMSALAAFGAATLFVAAMPQGADAARRPLKYGDRCMEWVGKKFYVNLKDSTAFRDDRGDYVLMAVGIDFAEFASEKNRVLLPLGTMRLSVAE